MDYFATQEKINIIFDEDTILNSSIMEKINNLTIFMGLEKNKMVHGRKIKDLVKNHNLHSVAKSYLHFINFLCFYNIEEKKITSELIKNLNKYLKTCDNHFFLQGQNNGPLKSQGKYRSTVLEEFFYIISKKYLNSLDEEKRKNILVGPAKCLESFFLDNYNQLKATTKDVDFAIYTKSNFLDKKYNCLIFGIEIKTYIDSTMFGNIENSYTKIRKFSPDADYALVSETEARSPEATKASLMKGREFIIRQEHGGESLKRSSIRNALVKKKPINYREMKKVFSLIFEKIDNFSDKKLP